ncbi:hypothetical protein [Rhodococcus sp. 1R11]|uniref:hypothetical protein n=1 Tax=Rhodococcus sp. 1R11 TaxID=2559614 RepID=UPI001431C9A2|nr:hypothetical protein [Rhodococcus sp. 1R11]
MALVNTGSGNAFRSSFPLVFSGSASSTTTAAGTMYDGSACPANSMASAESMDFPGPATT